MPITGRRLLALCLHNGLRRHSLLWYYRGRPARKTRLFSEAREGLGFTGWYLVEQTLPIAFRFIFVDDSISCDPEQWTPGVVLMQVTLLQASIKVQLLQLPGNRGTIISGLAAWSRGTSIPASVAIPQQVSPGLTTTGRVGLN
ncbi:uncharacterized protein ARMOST_10961 [Armillaria ostoyae]|uniref:Uncharacterized protein n=1 Tax=Armillaria ostoyae TaxID=47428 RepID=A0A284RFT0_ARMOS|nr:uncharacterized protein ARMOST_10961 [Armillaria ostoyae]